MTNRRLIAAVPISFACGAVACRLLLAHAPANLAADLRQPVPVAFGWRATGLAWWAIAAATWFAGAWAFARLSRRAAAPAALGVAVAGAAALAAALAWPAIASSDVYAYASFGERAAAGSSPYGIVQGSPADAIDRAAIWQWGATLPPDNYGPLFNALAGALAGAAHGDAAAAIAMFRLAACAACCLCAFFLWNVARQDRSLTVAAFFLNPLVIWSAAEGHNDFFALAFVLGGLALARRAPLLGGALAALGGLVKLPAIAAAGLAAVFWKSAGARFGIGAAAGSAIALAACVPLLTAVLARAAHPAPWATAPLLYPWYAVWLIPFLAAHPATRTASMWASAASVVAYLPDLWGNGSAGARVGISIVTLAAWLPVLARRRPRPT